MATQEQLAVLVCPYCDDGGEIATRSNGPHTEAYCVVCDSHVEFVQKGNPSKWKRRNGSTNLAKQSNWCHMCLRHRTEIESPKTLVGHHVVEVQKGGSDNLVNVWPLCTDCHNLVHWARKSYGGDKIDELVSALRERGSLCVTYPYGRDEEPSRSELDEI